MTLFFFIMTIYYGQGIATNSSDFVVSNPRSLSLIYR